METSVSFSTEMSNIEIANKLAKLAIVYEGYPESVERQLSRYINGIRDETCSFSSPMEIINKFIKTDNPISDTIYIPETSGIGRAVLNRESGLKITIFG